MKVWFCKFCLCENKKFQLIEGMWWGKMWEGGMSNCGINNLDNLKRHVNVLLYDRDLFVINWHVLYKGS